MGLYPLQETFIGMNGWSTAWPQRLLVKFYQVLKALQSDVKNNNRGKISPTTRFFSHLTEFANVAIRKEKSLMG